MGCNCPQPEVVVRFLCVDVGSLDKGWPGDVTVVFRWSCNESARARTHQRKTPTETLCGGAVKATTQPATIPIVGTVSEQ